MQLTKYSDYSLRVLIYVALRRTGELSQIDMICEAYNISKNHLVKVVHGLGQLGYLETVRGKNGGVRLALDPSDIRIGDLIRQTEATLSSFDCEHPPCAIVRVCRLRGVFAEAMKAYLDVLDKYTLADMVRRPGSLRDILIS
ncbi:Rrf2 family transcriptional regulator [Pseudobacteriovorax antillogorgiicola]|uniref:Transcriptional regulator, BadM/Rrf2 family n=1 Tax=Pseudobacteriovorax antillogorgiicola TaxID=1513793 RepID=A0A1Y6CF37_9BACT|nr:Rrf2 family transcriptional regulator [Pseudobacteriovorax antillogorgiicola]TCS47631.1 BadM/Rrf2 family transcriptional regulator [Pseudobacteriovorax antillogorgiicola]SMF59971.1 transcriptional regulator, BadM/Rrf2 family [Pseudobacteriovorax antillogorgiicola]